MSDMASDLGAMLGSGGGGFMPDARFTALRGIKEDLPRPLSVMRMRFGADVVPAAAPPPVMVPEFPAEPDPMEEARADAYAQGWADAQEAAEMAAVQADKTRGRMETVIHRLDGELAEQFRQRLMETVIALCESCLAPLALDKDALLRRVERAAAMFSRADDERLIRLHPDDLAAVQARLPEDWNVQADPTMERGAIRVESGGGEDGGAEDGPRQWRRAIAEALDVGGLD
ncbi:flagellar assembly protein FliH [Novosphingobium sp. SG751A]|uniref:FliH/SctL family protein n=1 Tax=Novosphingobium sp. SG751A TaxID=2587000 RepID=UPI001555D1D0|nr:FliH/SctL family protein [Novosphingobium sp. SG751A]NOW47572.1 flagellar assembly protein FliH [Novosphingobium sp. SG751A]